MTIPDHIRAYVVAIYKMDPRYDPGRTMIILFHHHNWDRLCSLTLYDRGKIALDNLTKGHGFLHLDSTEGWHCVYKHPAGPNLIRKAKGFYQAVP